MRKIKHIKAYDVLKSAQDISFDADRAVSDFRAFYPVASFHAGNVSDPRALDVLIEVIENVRTSLLSKRCSTNVFTGNDYVV